MNQLICPVCKTELAVEGKSYRCKKNHSFDIAASGYVHLLLSSQMHTKIPGDNKEMVAARKRFLEKGYYEPLRDALCACASEILCKKDTHAPVIVDAGCGEGYYTSALYTHLLSCGMHPKMMGFDISKFALVASAKRNKQLVGIPPIVFGVASLFSLPVADKSCDILINLFAPLCVAEFARVLKPKSTLVIVAPGKEHLWGLKSYLYEKPYTNELSDTTLAGFQLVKQKTVSFDTTFTSTEDILDVFSMTPYYWKTSKESAASLHQLTELASKVEFEILLYEKE